MVTINIEKRHLYIFSVVIGILIGVFAVNAFNSPPTWTTPPSNFGHSVDEVDWSQPILANVEIRSPVSIDFVKTTGLDTDPMFILWGDTVSGIKADERMRVTREGNVGIGISNPTEKLDVNGNIKTTTGMKGAAWVGYKWVQDGTTISCSDTGFNIKVDRYARVNNGIIEIKQYIQYGSGLAGKMDSGWVNKRYIEQSPSGFGTHTLTISEKADFVGGPNLDNDCILNWP